MHLKALPSTNKSVHIRTFIKTEKGQLRLRMEIFLQLGIFNLSHKSDMNIPQKKENIYK